MNSFIGVYDVIRDSKRVGTLDITQDGLMTVFDCTCNIETTLVTRLACVSDGAYVNIGVLIPKDGALKLRKSFSKNALNSMRIDIKAGFHAILPGEAFNQSDAASDAASADSIEIPAEAVGVAAETSELSAEAIEVTAEKTDMSAEVAKVSAKKIDMSAEVAKVSAKKTPESVTIPAKNPFVTKQAPLKPSPEAAPVMTASETLRKISPDAAAVPVSAAPVDAPDVIDAAADYAAEKTVAAANLVNEAPPPPRETMKPAVNPQWRSITDPGSLFDDEDIINACKNVKNAFTREQDGINLLAIPLSPTEPFPLMPVFCFGDTETVNGHECVVFKSKNGKFII